MKTGFLSKLWPLLIIPLIPVLLIVLILAPVWIPAEYCLFRRSPYCKDGRGKYTLLIGTSSYYRFYNAVRKEDLSIEYLPCSHNAEGYPTTTAYGYFLYGHTLIQIEYYAGRNMPELPEHWQEDPGLSEMTAEADRLKGPGYCTGAVVLIGGLKAAKLTKEDLPDWFIPYDRGRKIEALKAYIQAHPLQ